MTSTVDKLKAIVMSTKPDLVAFNEILSKASYTELSNMSASDASFLLRSVASISNVATATVVKSVALLLDSPIHFSNADVGDALMIASRNENFSVINTIIDHADYNQLSNVTGDVASRVLRTVAQGTDFGKTEAQVISTIKNIFESPLSSHISNADVGEALRFVSRNGDFGVLNTIIDHASYNQLSNISNVVASEVLRAVAQGTDFGKTEAQVISTIKNIFESPLSSSISNADVGEALTIASRNGDFGVLNTIIDFANYNQLSNVTGDAASQVLRAVAHGTDLGKTEAQVINTIKNIFESPLSIRISNVDVGEALTIASRNGDFGVLNTIIDFANYNQLSNISNVVASGVLRAAAHAYEDGATVQNMLLTIDKILSSPLAMNISKADLLENHVQYGASGSDTLTGSSARDILFGKDGNDVIKGNDGDDLIVGGNGSDLIYGGSGDDLIYTWRVNAYNVGSAAGDVAYGGAGNDVIYGGTGRDQLYGEDGNDKLYSADGADYLDGGAGDDLLFAGGGDDRLYGGTGNDRLTGEVGNDFLHGGSGNDVLDGGSGLNVLYGGTGMDKFIFDTQSLDGMTDVIKDYQLGERIDITAILDALNLNIDLASAAILDYIKVTTVGDSKTLSIDLDGKGAGTAVDVVTVEHAGQLDVLVDQTSSSQVVHIFV